MLGLAIRNEHDQILPRNTVGAPFLTGADIAKCIELHESLSPCTAPDMTAKDSIASFQNCSSEMIQIMIQIMNGYLRKDLEKLKKKLQDSFRRRDSQVTMDSALFLEWVYKVKIEGVKASLKGSILTCNNISSVIINKGALAKYSLLEMLLGALSRQLGAKVLIQQYSKSREPSTINYDALRKDILQH